MSRTTTLTAAIAFATIAASTGAQQHALSFDGFDDAARNTDMPGQLQHTYEVIGRLRGVDVDSSAAETLAGQNYGGTCSHGSSLRRDSAVLSLHHNVDVPGCNNDSKAVYDVGNESWHHFAATFDGMFQRLYVDGALVATEGNSNPTVNSGFALGTTVDLIRPASVDIAEVRFWDHARTQEQLLATIEAGSVTGPEPGLVALYLLEEGAGQMAFDSSGNGYHLTLGSSSNVDSRDPTWIEYCGAIPYGVDADANQTLDQTWNPGASLADGTFDITGATPNSSGLLLVGLDPFDAMAKNTTILVNPSTAIYLSVTYDAAGALSLPVDLTATPSTIGLTVRTQAFELTGSTFTGLRASNALATTLCP